MLLIASSAYSQTEKQYIREQHANFISKRDNYLKDSSECASSISNTADAILVNKVNPNKMKLTMYVLI